MRVKLVIGAAVIAMTVALAGCSSSTSAKAQSGVPSTLPAGASQISPSSAATTATPPNTPTSSAAPTSAVTTSAAPVAEPVSALLADIAGPVTTANMPKAQPEWIAAVQKNDDLGQPIDGEPAMSLNLVALVDEAAKTSDVDALQKLCNLCDAQELEKVLTATDSAGLTGFQELSRVLEQTHPAQSYTQSSGWDFPGFTRPEKGAPTELDQQDIRLLNGYSKAYTGIRAQFMNLNDGPNPYDGWTGVGSPNT
jgi:hypothetical protein